MKVTCKYCKTKIDKDKAYSIEYLTSSLSIRNKYYCNEGCYKKSEQEKENKIRDKEIEVNSREITREILGIGSDKNIYFSKMYKDLRDTFGDKNIYNYVKNEKVNIENVLNSKDFATTNSKVKYFFAMAQNQLEYYKVENNNSKTVSDTEKEIYIDDFEIIDKKVNNSRSVESLLDDIL